MVRTIRFVVIANSLLLQLFLGCQSLLINHNSISFVGRRHRLGFPHRKRISAPAERSCLHMKIRVGILGLPNVGKSTLFNALAQKSIAQAANFPFCTIEPNIAPIAVPDAHLERLGTLASSKRTIPATIEWVDVAGLAKGASRGEGLGNQFLATLRECDAICHLVRTFEDPDIVHVDGEIDAVADAEVINLELLLADLAHVERRLDKTTCVGEERTALEAVAVGLQEGVPARAIGLSNSEVFAIKSMGLLTLKKVLYAFNVDEIDFIFGREDALVVAENVLKSIQYCDPSKDMFTLVSAKLEAAVSERTKDEQLDYLISLGMEVKAGSQIDDLLSHNVLPLMILELLDLSLVYTGPGVPPERSRTTKAYIFPRNSRTTEGMASRLHSEIQRGFIRAEVMPASELLLHSTYNAAKDAGCIRTEGRDYVLNSEDVVLIKWK